MRRYELVNRFSATPCFEKLFPRSAPSFDLIKINADIGPAPRPHDRDALLRNQGVPAVFTRIRWHCLFQKARCEVLR